MVKNKVWMDKYVTRDEFKRFVKQNPQIPTMVLTEKGFVDLFAEKRRLQRIYEIFPEWREKNNAIV